MKALSLLIVCISAKALVLAGRSLPWSLWMPLAFLWQDFLLALLFAAVIWLLRRRPWAGWSLYAAAALYIAINVPVARVLSTPLTWPMLRATRGTLLDSIAYHVTAANLLCLGGVLAAAVLFPIALPKLLAHMPARWRAAAVVLAVAILPLGPLAADRTRTSGLDRNALAALLTSGLPHIAAADLGGDWHSSPLGGLADADLSRLRGAAAGRNVVLVHLESTAARHLGPYGAARDPMPRLSHLVRGGILFENAYTAYPETIKSFFAVQCACWPALDTKPRDNESVTAPGLAAVLAERGYRTGLFHSGRFDYLGMWSVLRGRGYEVMKDAGDIGGQRESSFGIDEHSTVASLLHWLDEGPADVPFLVTYLPIAGHHPYETPAPGPFAEASEVDRYHNALHYADEALGELLDGLHRRGLDRDTLFVILGDHGEAFGEHAGNYGHTLALYEENVRVPLLFAAPGLWDTQVRLSRAAGLVDVAPTVLDLLGVSVPQQWQGRSLLDPANRLALFCTDYSLGLLGLRDGRWKCIHEIESGRSSLYDLDADPGEQADLADVCPDRVAAYREHLLRWAAAQKYRVKHP
jgi:phosphoglycerol transferase MdoB-like AlkP superfamily enzyme